MIELPIEVLKQAVKPQHEHRHFHKHAAEGGVVVVDTLTGCLKEAGEIIQAGLTPHQLVEVGELVMLEGQLASPADSDDVELDPEADKEIDLDELRRELHSAAASGDSSLRSVMREGSEISGVSGESVERKSLDSGRSGSGSFSKRRRKSISSGKIGEKISSKKAKSREDEMVSWLGKGNVVYKSVGMGLMDLVVGGDLVALAREKGIGTNIANF